MNYQLEGKTAFVSAGAHGIGEAIADLLTQEGVRVIVADQDEAALREKSPRWVGTVAADLGTAEGMDHAISEVLRIFGDAPDILVNNLGVGGAASFEDICDEQWARSFNINLMGCIRACRATPSAHGKTGLGIGGEYRLGPCQAAGAVDDGLWGLQSRLALPHEGFGHPVRSACAGERSAAGPDLVEDVDPPRGPGRSTCDHLRRR